MIRITDGNLLTASVDALVNTVNTEGVMGKGIALQFKRAYPEVFDKYEADCKAGRVTLGSMHVVDLGGLVGGPRWVINFPTKGHWRAKSKLKDIEAGLDDLAKVIERLGIESIAIPPLGCGHGGLRWADVRPLIERKLQSLTNTQVLLFAPTGTPAADEMPNKTQAPKPTVGNTAVVALVSKYMSGLIEPVVRLLEVHKLMYFLQEAGEPLRLNYAAERYGPYASNLRHVLGKIEGHWISGFGDGQDSPTKAIELVGDAESAALEFLETKFDTQQRMERVATLIDGFESPFGLELLSTTHWIMCRNERARQDPHVAAELVRGWNDRKAGLMKPEHVEKAWARLKEQHWDTESRSANRLAV